MTPNPAPPGPEFELGLVWLRRDLRLHDHAALHHALSRCRRVQLVFVFDTDILQPLLDQGIRGDRRVTFIHASLLQLDARLRRLGGALWVEHASAAAALPALARRLGAQAVFTNRDYEPSAQRRDACVAGELAGAGIEFLAFDDQVMLPPPALRTGQGRPYAVFTPYRNAWLARLRASGGAELDERACPLEPGRLLAVPEGLARLPEPAQLGFAAPAPLPQGVEPGSRGARRAWEAFQARLQDYAAARDFPAREGTSGLSVHLRFGTLSVRELGRHAWQAVQQGSEGAASWLSELVWRDFYAQVLFHHPQVAQGRSFRPAYDRIEWEQAPERLRAWCEGRTGYPLVDAAMRELLDSGRMHNRLRMVVASFLCKDLGLDWRLGEAHFARWLLDFDLASNNGGWQWASSSGCDAQPWFRIFNPVEQSRRFDPDGHYIRRWVPELAALDAACIHAPWTAGPAQLRAAGVRLGEDYPLPVVDHAQARQRTLQRYAVVRDDAQQAAQRPGAGAPRRPAPGSQGGLF
ncbi:MAG: DNA photolyase family protein [Betaproteobacteria bacterium]|nr:DNA photolyase family protein [Betaproteobacteria bacterium]